MVLLSWQFLHSACQLDSSQNSFSSPRCGTTWSTTEAFTSLPCSWQRTHSGCAFRNLLLALRHRLSYPRLDDVARSPLCNASCSSQYFPEVNFGHPGCLQGFFGFIGTAPPPFLCNGQGERIKPLPHAKAKEKALWIPPQSFLHFFAV